MQHYDNHFHLVIPHPCEPRALVLRGADGWTLPHYHDTQPVLWADVGHVNAAAKRLLGLDAATLRCLRVVPHPESRRVDFGYVIDTLNPHWHPRRERGGWPKAAWNA